MNRLFSPIRIGNIELRNRIIFPPMTTGFEEKGEVTERITIAKANKAQKGQKRKSESFQPAAKAEVSEDKEPK